MKRFIVSEEHRIELHDLVSQEMERQMTSLSKLSMSQPGLTLDQIFERVQRYERALDILGPIIAQGCYWGSGGQAKLWATALERTAELARIAGGMTLLLQLRMYPTCMLLYLGGLSAIAANRYETLKTLCTTEIADNGQTTPLILKAMPPNVLENDWARKLPGLERHHTPMSDRLFEILREPLREFVPSDQRYDELFDRFEYLMSLIYFDTKMKKDTWRWAPVGRYSWKDSFSGNTISTQIAEEQQRDGKDWPPLKAGLFESESRFQEVKAAFDAEILAKARFM